MLLTGARQIMAAKAQVSLVATFRTKAPGWGARSLECNPEPAKFHVNESIPLARYTARGLSNLPAPPGNEGLPPNPLPIIKPAIGYVVNIEVGERRGNIRGRAAGRTGVERGMIYFHRS